MYTLILGLCSYLVLALTCGICVGRRLDRPCKTNSADSEPDPLIDMREAHRG